MNKITQSLTELWLNEKEALIYTIILKLGFSSLTDISEWTWIKRSTLYSYIESLLKKWFISKTIKSKRILYIAENPESLLTEYNKKVNNFSDNLPSMLNLFNNSKWKPNTTIYEWKVWIKKIYKEIWDTFSPIYAMLSAESFIKNVDLEDRKQFLNNIELNDNKLYNLLENNKAWLQFKREFEWKVMKAKIFPKKFDLTVDILIYWNKVAMISFDNINGIVIENKEIADFQRNIHQLLWSMI